MGSDPYRPSSIVHRPLSIVHCPALTPNQSPDAVTISHPARLLCSSPQRPLMSSRLDGERQCVPYVNLLLERYHPMSVEANKAVIGRWVAAYNAGNLDIIDEIMAPDLITHTPTPPDGMPVAGRAGLKRSLAGIQAALPDQHETLDDLIAEGDRIAWRW